MDLRRKRLFQVTAYLPAADTEEHVAGVSMRQPAIERVGLGEVDFKLVPEPKNPHDPNAVRVLRGGWHVGYLPAPIAALWSRFLTERVNYRATIVRGVVGEWEKGYYISLRLPAEEQIIEWLHD